MAQEREKRRIVIASILKPVDDTRMLDKMGVSLASTGDWDVSIIAYQSTVITSNRGIQLIPLRKFRRLSFGRWLARWKVLLEAWKCKPTLFIFNTHELLIPALVLKVTRNSMIIYDVRENFYLNIRHSESLPPLFRFPLALLVRFKEKLLAPAIDHYFLAEKGYEHEFKFHRGGWTVVENKAFIDPKVQERKKEPGKLRLLFSGTLAESTGVFRAIQLAKSLFALNKNTSLTIIGYASTEIVRRRIRDESKSCSFIHVIGLDHLVPHQQIAELIQQSDAGILSYPFSELTRNSVPSKLFEYLHCRLPIILERGWPWIDRYSSFHPFLFVDFVNPDHQTLLNALLHNEFYLTHPTDVGWESEAPGFLQIIKKLMV